MSHAALQNCRPKALLLAVAIVAAAGTLTAQKKMTPTEAELRYDRANQSFADARYEDAYKRYNEVFSSGNDGPLIIRALKGMIKSALRLSSFNVARQEAEALKAKATDEEALTLFGDSLWAGGLFDEAEATYGTARERYPGSARARFGMARSLATRGRVDEALAEALTAATASPADPDILALLAELYERQFRYDDALHVYEQYVKLLPARVRGDSEAASVKIRLLRGFAGRTPSITEPADGAVTVPFTIRDKKVVVAGVLNGKNVEFVLDTGADRTAITGATADRAGIRGIVDTLITGVGVPGVRRLAIGRADSLVIGHITIRDFPVSVRRSNMPGTQAWQNETFSPAGLGLSVVVDYKRRELTLARELAAEQADFRLPLRVYRLPFVRGMVNDKYPASFIVDTGGEMVSISRDMATQLAMRPSRKIALKVWGAMGLDPEAFVLPFVDLNFDAIQYQKFAVAVLNLRAPSVLLGVQLGGILGYAFLNEYRVGLDFTRGELRLQKSHALAGPPPRPGHP